ncbi:TPA: hypothetical protein I7203_21125 [Vibrio vulnificus]|nr:hypothetical protein [Vibrio vulnificus]HAS6277041.1 hypothetical protein [Vibrio vulnificus]HDY7540148.1 hypothetical protein [Vibrio vulnificus]HDY7736013.1 hypothetical protein [Vibrio vulnificus]HDY8048725.1 hypothetical protein [Vibrio vulnificus]
MEATISDEINSVRMEKPHVVILGAGASYAAFPNGDKNGRRLPLMNNFIEILGLESLINSTGLSFPSNNFEDIYSTIYESDLHKDVCFELESAVYNYFSEMELPDEPTIYDHLVLSLRRKDTIATFNWDPFLTQALVRNMGKMHEFGIDPPVAYFLHGNVKMGSCIHNHHIGLIGTKCQECHADIQPSKLLYPVKEKNYHLDQFISKQWELLGKDLKSAFMVTVFGYGAPSSDASAIELFKKSWGTVSSRNMEEFEVIDIRDEEDVRSTWSRFIHTHHYRVEDSFYNSFIANHPRRTGEAYIHQYLEAKWIRNNPTPKCSSLNELWDWYERLYSVEASGT